MRRLVLLLTLFVLSAAPAGAVGRPMLSTPAMQPVTVHGARFRPAELVTIRIAAAGSVRVHVVRATSAGTFTTTFTAVSLGHCAPFFVTARGSRGSIATLRRSPFQDCAPLRSPPRIPSVEST